MPGTTVDIPFERAVSPKVLGGDTKIDVGKTDPRGGAPLFQVRPSWERAAATRPRLR